MARLSRFLRPVLLGTPARARPRLSRRRGFPSGLLRGDRRRWLRRRDRPPRAEPAARRRAPQSRSRAPRPHGVAASAGRARSALLGLGARARLRLVAAVERAPRGPML